MNTVAVVIIAVVNSLWQAAVLAGIVWLVLRFMPRVNGATRFAIWWAVLGVVLAIPAAPTLASSVREWLRTPTIASARPLYAPAAGPVSLIGFQPLLTVESRSESKWPAGVAALWAMVFLYRLINIVKSYARVRCLKRRAYISRDPLPGSRRRARLLLSADVDSPIAVGFAPPAVILPVWLQRHLSREEMDHVLLHETAHLERRDDWTTLLARILGAALGLHPVAAWILRRTEIEREVACDDWVVARTRCVKAYALSLAKLHELRFPEQQLRGERLLAMGLFSDRSSLGSRLESLLGWRRQFTARVSGGCVAAACGVLLVLGTAASVLPGWIAFAQAPRPSFEVASIKRNAADANGLRHENGAGLMAAPGGRFTATFNPVSNFITNAYGIALYQVIGAPNWVTSEKYDIEARGPATAGQKEMMLMLQSLLADRFAMKAHFETRQMPAYILTAAKGGPKMRFSHPENCVPRDPSKPRADQVPNICGSNHLGRDGWNATNISMPGVTGVLAIFMRGPVIDQTGINGTFDVSLRVSGDLSATDNPDAPPALSTALRETLGLELKRGRGPVDVLVIERIERPTAN
jgi:uncharacterized protein (TIGR03435 family)